MKKPIYKKWWFWVIIAVLVIGIGNSGDNNTTNTNPNPTTQQEEIVKETNKLKKALKSTSINNEEAENIIKTNIPNFKDSGVKKIRKEAECAYELKTDFGNYYILVFQKEPSRIFQIKSTNKDDTTKYYYAKYDGDKLIEYPYHICDKNLTNTRDPEPGSNEKTYYYECSICKYNWYEKEKISEKIKAPILFSMNTYEIDYLGGITLNVNIKNLTNKQVKYYTYQLSLYNGVGDKISSDMYNGNKDGSMVWTITGPVAANGNVSQKAIGFYNNNFKGTYSLDAIKIEFMDGQTILINSSNMNQYEKLVK